MQTLTYGLKKPQTGDKGSIFFPALAADIAQLDAHSHNGTDSAKIPTSSLNLTTQTILAANWVLVDVANYRQLITMPSGLTFDAHTIHFKNSGNGDQLSLSVEKASANTYYVYINDNSISLTALYI